VQHAFVSRGVPVQKYARAVALRCGRAALSAATDRHKIFIVAVDDAFGNGIDCGMLVKIYGAAWRA
jgi:hypothetical protein